MISRFLKISYKVKVSFGKVRIRRFDYFWFDVSS